MNLKKPYIIADIGANHKQRASMLCDLIVEAKEAGCDAIKYQSYMPHDLTLDEELSKIYESCYLDYELIKYAYDYAKKIGIPLFASVFNPSRIPFEESLGCPMYKIASFEIHYLDLLDAVRKTGKPTLISLGMASYSDLSFIASRFSPLDTILMKCVSNYPANAEDFHLATIPGLKRDLGFDIGISDHTGGLGVSVAAVALGAVVVERHFTLKRDGGIDDCVSLKPKEMAELVIACNEAYQAIGTNDYTVKGDRKYLRSLCCIEDMKKGDLFTKENVGVLRPNLGISPKAMGSFIGKRAGKDIKVGEPLHLDCIGG